MSVRVVKKDKLKLKATGKVLGPATHTNGHALKVGRAWYLKEELERVDDAPYVFRVNDKVKVRATGRIGRITRTNGHAFKVAGRWYLAPEIDYTAGVGENIKVAATGRIGTIKASNGHAYKVFKRWHLWEELRALPYAGTGPHHARLQRTCLRIKDPRITVPFYERHFGMKLVHWQAFPQWGYSLYFMERPRQGQAVPACTLESTSVENERYLQTMSGATVEFMHNHGSEMDDAFAVWSGNTGGDADGPLKRESPAARGFGHIAFNCDDVYAASATLERNGVKFQKKPDEGRMKGLAFALDPDGYWIEIVRREKLNWPEYYNFSQTMMRVKDGPASVDFYCKHLGMTLVRKMDVPKYKFTNYFLVSLTPAELEAARMLDPLDSEAKGSLNPLKSNSLTKVLWNQALELTWNHGTESDPNFQVHNGNTEPKGFGHIGFLVDDVEHACAQMEADGVVFRKRPHEGGLGGVAVAQDPNGYWVELVDRSASFAGICSNY